MVASLAVGTNCAGATASAVEVEFDDVSQIQINLRTAMERAVQQHAASTNNRDGDIREYLRLLRILARPIDVDDNPILDDLRRKHHPTLNDKYDLDSPDGFFAQFPMTDERPEAPHRVAHHRPSSPRISTVHPSANYHPLSLVMPRSHYPLI